MINALSKKDREITKLAQELKLTQDEKPKLTKRIADLRDRIAVLEEDLEREREQAELKAANK